MPSIQKKEIDNLGILGNLKTQGTFFCHLKNYRNPLLKLIPGKLKLIKNIFIYYPHWRASDPFRLYDPVVLNGNDLYELIGADPLSIVGFR